MSKPERGLGAAARARLDEYLDAVERALAESGTSRAERRTVCDEIEAQAREMVVERCEGEPTEQDMLAVLAELDDPEAYRDAREPGGQATAANDPTDVAKVHPCALSVFLIPFVEVFLMFTPFHPRGETHTFIWWGVVSFLCLVLAVWAIHDIHRRPDRYRGVALAVFGMLAIPMMVLSIFLYLFIEHCDCFGYQAAATRRSEVVSRARLRAAARDSGAAVRSGEAADRLEGTKGIEEKSAIAPPGALEKLSPRQRWLASNRDALEIVEGTTIVVGLLALSALVFLVVYRGCRPRQRETPDLPRDSSQL